MVFSRNTSLFIQGFRGWGFEQCHHPLHSPSYNTVTWRLETDKGSTYFLPLETGQAPTGLLFTRPYSHIGQICWNPAEHKAHSLGKHPITLLWENVWSKQIFQLAWKKKGETYLGTSLCVIQFIYLLSYIWEGKETTQFLALPYMGDLLGDLLSPTSF